MCGFGGFLERGHGSSPETLHVRATAMAGAVHHRGPDDAGTWVDADAGVGFGHRRLSIVDLSPEGHQPMESAGGRYVLSYNGEIYNFPALRRELEQSGARFRGHSDTEVLLAAFERWGVEGALRRSVGMFAFAVWDRAGRTLVLARDRLGEKPLYYGWQGGAFLFGSELKALRRHPAWEGEIDRDALALFLRLGYIPSPHSIYRGIHKLLPGTVLRVGAGTERDAVPEPYWSVDEAVRAGREDAFSGSDEEAVDALEDVLGTAVAGQMVADVPLGAFLSGGIDSSVVVALMQRASSRPVRTFTIGFHEKGFDEARHARAVAEVLGTDHAELYVTPEDALALVPTLPGVYDEPFADVSQIPTLMVAAFARRHVTVALSGDGGDELFGGYDRYPLGERLWRRVRAIPAPLRPSAAALVGRTVPAALEAALRMLGRAAPDRLLGMEPAHHLRKLGPVLGAGDVQGIYTGIVSCWPRPGDVVVRGTEPPLFGGADSRIAGDDSRARMMYLDTLSYLPDDILTKVDRAAMAVSLETRAPFLDHRVVELAWRMPLSMKMRDGRGKHVLRRLLYRHVPPALVDRPKTGFRAPIGTWLRGALRDWAEAQIAAQRLDAEGYLKAGPIRRIWRDHLTGVRSAPYPLWHVLMFQAWLEKEGRSSGPESSPQPAAVSL